MRSITVAAAILTLAACHQRTSQQPAAHESAAASAANDGIKGVHRDHKGTPEPNVSFSDPDGKPVTLAEFKGKPLLVNLWASWCAPCVKELPTLDQLSRTGGIKVLAVSQDMGPHASVVAFLQEHQIATLDAYQDANMGLSGALGPDAVLPTSILYDSNGNEVWRYVGDLDWTSPEATKLLLESGEAKPS